MINQGFLHFNKKKFNYFTQKFGRLKKLRIFVRSIRQKQTKTNKMKTLEQIKSKINIQELIKNDKYGTYEDWTNEEIIDAVLFSKVCSMFRLNCESETKEFINSSKTAKEISTTYIIKNESIIETLRDLYRSTTNKFVKSVVDTIGQTKKFSQKQIEIVADEIIKTNLTLKF